MLVLRLKVYFSRRTLDHGQHEYETLPSPASMGLVIADIPFREYVAIRLDGCDFSPGEVANAETVTNMPCDLCNKLTRLWCEVHCTPN